MKLLIHSNGPLVKTGYGVQVALLVDRLVAAGHDVAVSATYGQPAGTGLGTYTTPAGDLVTVYPNWQLVSGEDVLADAARLHFGGDEGWVIPLLDVWSLGMDRRHAAEIARLNIAAWAPVDHDPVPPIVLDFFKRFPDARCVAMSRHGQSEFVRAGVDAAYIPLCVDTSVYRPTFEIAHAGQMVSARRWLNVSEGAFVVGLVAMNKDPNDRKGFQEAFTAFARFQGSHPEAVLHIHSDINGHQVGGLDLLELAYSAGIPPQALSVTNQLDYRTGLSPQHMAAMYTCFDVLLAPSAGEGFCVPLVEAQACGVPVIASDFTAQPELVGAGWTVSGQRIWDQPSRSFYQRPNIDDIVGALEAAYDADLVGLSEQAIAFARHYDADYVFDSYWRPYLETLDTRPPATKVKMQRVAVLVPAMRRPHNVERLVHSFNVSNDETSSADLFYVLDEDDVEQIAAVEAAGARWLPANRGTSFAGKINAGFEQTDHSWIFVTGDDVEFTPGWLEAARELSDRYDVIGTNDSEPGRVRNPKVANGSHADHFFIRRQYVCDEGGSLEGPGMVIAEAYYHFFGDVETIQLAKARGVFAPCLRSVVIHHHPGYDGREDLREADPVYMKAVEFSEMDKIAFGRRAGLIEQHKVVKKDIWS